MLFPNATLIIFVISFLIFMVLLNELFIKPVGEVIEKRARRISAGIEASQSSREGIKTLTEEYEKLLAHNREQAQSEINSAVTTAQAARNKELGVVKDRVRKRLDESREQLQGEKSVLIDNLVSEEAQLVSQIVGKVLGEPGKQVDINSDNVKRALEGAV